MPENSSLPTPPPLANKRQAAHHCSISTRCIDNWMRDGVIPYLKIGKLVRFNLEELDDALRRFTINGVPDAGTPSKPGKEKA